jgi:CHAT domain-containing protein
MRLPSVAPGRDTDLELALSLKDVRSRLVSALASARATAPEFMPTARSATQLQGAVPRGGALVLPMMTSQGGAVFILVDGHPPGDQVIRLDQHACSALHRRVAATTARDDAVYSPQAWRGEIEATCAAAWTHLMQPLHSHLAGLRLEQGASVVLMPQGELSLLPLHAASPDGTEGTPFLSHYAVSYCPSGYALIRSVLRAASREAQLPSLLAVVDPTGDLPFARREGEAIAASFDPARVRSLVGPDASKAAISSACEGRSCVHFGCHGRHARRDPLKSRLQLAQGQALTMADILTSLDLHAASLVTLSACDTGVIDVRESPDEFMGLPAEFLQAGATTVVSTLWAVNDLSTMLLMQRFYQRHILHGEPAARALREAQLWLRSRKASELADYFGREEDALMPGGGEALVHASKQFARFAAMSFDTEPFAHPYHWAPFVLNGDPGEQWLAAGDMT